VIAHDLSLKDFHLQSIHLNRHKKSTSVTTIEMLFRAFKSRDVP
jgi:hypothetical protein